MSLQERCAQIIENLQLEDVKRLLERLEIPFQEKSDCLLCKTMCHHDREDEASWKLYYYKDSHLFMCYSNCGGMNIFKFLSHYYETRGYEYDWYEDVFCVARDCVPHNQFEFRERIDFEKKTDRYKKRVPIKLPEFKKGILDVFTKYYAPEWLQDGISKEAMDKFNILFSIPQNKIIIPHYDVEGRLVGIRGRALNEWEIEAGGKYMPVQIEGKWYKHKLSMNLYGLYQNKEDIKKYGICYICESEKAVMQLESFKMPNCAVAVCGSSLNIFQLKILLKECHPKEIVICFDKEEKKGEDKYLKKLKKQCEKYKNYCNFSYIYDTENLLELKDSPTDKGQAIFEELLRKRRKIK